MFLSLFLYVSGSFSFSSLRDSFSSVICLLILHAHFSPLVPWCFLASLGDAFSWNGSHKSRLPFPSLIPTGSIDLAFTLCLISGWAVAFAALQALSYILGCFCTCNSCLLQLVTTVSTWWLKLNSQSNVEEVNGSPKDIYRCYRHASVVYCHILCFVGHHTKF